MVAHFKTELWLSKTGQVAQFDPDYSPTKEQLKCSEATGIPIVGVDVL